MKIVLAAIGLILAASALAQPPAAPAPAPAPAPAAIDYADPAAWLCLPGRQDACGRPLQTAALEPNGYGAAG